MSKNTGQGITGRTLTQKVHAGAVAGRPKTRKYHENWCDRMNGGFECNCEAGDPSPTIEEQIAQLKAAGWIPLTPKCWKAPTGSGCAGVFLGPHGAWKAMQRHAR